MIYPIIEAEVTDIDGKTTRYEAHKTNVLNGFFIMEDIEMIDTEAVDVKKLFINKDRILNIKMNKINKSKD